jgi:hypothetical protein
MVRRAAISFEFVELEDVCREALSEADAQLRCLISRVFWVLAMKILVWVFSSAAGQALSARWEAIFTFQAHYPTMTPPS